MSATSINSTSVPINSSSSSSNSGSNNVLSSASNIVILENQILDSNDVVAAAGLQQLSNAGTIKLTRDCAVQYSNLINSYGSANSSSGSSNSSSSNNGSIVTNSNTINIIPGDASQTSSRVQVLSNVQLVSKGGSQPSTFSYVDASGKNFNVLTSSGKISTNKLISVPITKVKTFNQIGQQQQTPQTQIVSSQLQQSQQHPVQKVSVPRSIQLVTRIPNSTISVSNGRVSQIAPAIPPQQQQQQAQISIQQFTDSGAGISSSSLDMKNTAQGSAAIPSVISNKNVTVKGKAATAASLKVLQNATITPGPKTSVGKGMSVSLKSVRNNSKNTLSGVNSQYFVKNSTNGTVQQQPSGTTTSIYTTSPAQAVYHNPTPHPPQQAMQIPIGTATAPPGKGKGIYKTSKNQLIQLQQQQQQHQPSQSPQRTVAPQSPSSAVGLMSSSTSTTYGTSPTNVPPSPIGNRYQNYNNSYSIPVSLAQSQSSSSSNFKTFNHLYAGASPSSMGTFDSSSSHEHPVPSVTVTGYTSSTGKGKKYGSIANSEQSSVSQSYAASAAVKVKSAARGRNNSLSANYQPLESSGSYQRYSASPSRQQQFHPSSPQQQIHHANATPSRDEHLFINGQQMTDETSARILQSLSQKSQTESNSSTTGKYSNYRPQQQFTFYGSDSVPQLSQNNVPAAFLPGGIGTNTSGSSTNSTSSTTPLGVVYDPSDARFYEDKPDGRRTSTSETITYSSENIPLREGYPAHYNYNYREDDDQIGVEVRPAPVDTSNGRFHILQAVMQDHTYFAVLPELKPPELPPVSHLSTSPQQQQYVALTLPQHTQLQAKHKSSSPAPAVIVASASATASSPASALAAPVPASTSIPPVAVPAPLTQMSLNNLATITSSSGVPGSASPAPTVVMPTVATSQPVIGSSTLAGSSSAGLDYIYQSRPQDDDANSVISTGSRNFNNMDNDLGEETETAPEGEGEDDSVTRCICDLTHDDGYMICCDKCSAWQHVDCMGIDRLNIPDEYNCEMCQPRAVDKNRARLLQMEKRKEQSLFLSNNNLQQMQLTDADVSSTNLINVPNVGAVGTTAVVSSTGSGKGANQYTTGKAVAGSKKGKASSSSKKKAADGSAASTKKTNKKTTENTLNRVNGKRKELKKPSKKKTKTVEQNAEKMSNMIRTWIDNYERAITNHYSPELRARLQAFGKMQSHNPLLNVDRLIPATAVSNLMQKCTTVPHAGGKILISTGDIEPKTPIIEIRGKYMISSQHKQLQSLFNMAANGKLGNNKNAGPFLFLYQLTNGGMELCVDTRTYGNDARFVRRSCRPNAEILHNVDKGVVHLYIVSTVNIKANTEITIKHDEQLIQRVGGVVILTHTTVTNICACGLIKECQYSAQLSEGLLPATTSGISAVTACGPVTALPASAIPPMTPISAQGVSSTVNNTTPNASKPSKNKKNNGALGEPAAEKKPAKKRNSRSTSGANAESRLRSISSSGDSTNEMMLYFQQQQSPAPHQQPNSHAAAWNQQLSRQPHSIGGVATGGLNLTMPATIQAPQQQQQLTLGSLPPHDISPLPCSEEMPMSTSGQLLQHHLHQWQQQQHPNLSNLVHGHSPQNQQQATQQPPPPVHPSQTPPPMSPVMGLNNRPGFYTEIKSPINSPPLCFSGGPPPPLAVPTVVHSPVKSIPQLQSPQSKVCVTKPAPAETQHQPTNEASPSIPEHALAEEQTRLELIQQQQQLHQQQIMEDILKIKIKSPAASPVKQEPPSLSPTSSSMLSPPPPPPIPIAQRLLCAETLKNELFHSHFTQQQQQSQHVSSPPAPVTSPQLLQPTLLKSPVKVEYPSYPSPRKEIKQEIYPESASGHLELKTEHEIKTEPAQAIAPPVLPVEDFPKIMKEEQPEQSTKAASRPSTPVQVEEIKKEDPLLSTSLCDSVPSSPVKNHTSSPVASCNSANSSPHVLLHQQGTGSSNKKKSGASRENSVSYSGVAPPVKEEKKPSRKLTREERKMEAIVKAFEKMEQSQQRKQELKEQRKEGKRRSVSSSTPDESIPSGSSSAKKRSLSSSQKRKKKKSKSLSQHFGSPTQSRKKKLSKSSKSSKKSSPDHHGGSRPYESKAAELLLTFSQSAADKSAQPSYFGDDVKPLDSTNSSSTISSNLPLLSSACMLVEAAVGPLEQQQQSSSSTPGPQEQDFKFPHKAKTKKSMSREWLSGQVSDVPFRRVTPDQDSGYMSEEKPHDFRRTNAEGLATPLGVDVSEAATNNLCIAAKKVEEFIAQNSPQSDEISTSGGVGGGGALASSSSSTSLGVASTSEPSQTQTSCVPESAAAKKRWLRQAISEETDEQNQASSSPPPPNGFTTPLKKRRVIRTPEDAPSQQHQSNHLDLLAQQQQQPPQVLAAAQKIDFGGPPTQQQQQLMTVLTQPGYPVERSNSYWNNNAGPPYSSPAIVAEEKHAIDLSRTAPVAHRLPPPPRIAPYKIVPIAQALTPLHFTDDPEPLPVVAPPPPTPIVSQEQQQLHHHHHHMVVPPSETIDFSRQVSPAPEIPQRMCYEPSGNAPPPASAVAAVVPASLMPPEPQQLYPPVRYHHHEGDDTATALRNSLPPPRSKGSQKYIGSPAKFDPVLSSAESPQNSSMEAAGIPEKNSTVAISSDVDEENAALSTASTPTVEHAPPQSLEQIHEMTVDTVPGSSESAVAKAIDDGIVSAEDKGGVAGVVAPDLVQQEQKETVVQVEEVVESEVVVEQVVLEPMDTNEPPTTISAGECAAVQEVVSSEPTTTATESRPPVKSDAVNGREKPKKTAPREECENNELEDLQKVIASFHSENIMTLISRNKKAKKGGRDNDDKPAKSGSRKHSRNKQNASTAKAAEVVPRVVPDNVQLPPVDLPRPTVAEACEMTNIAVAPSVESSAGPTNTTLTSLMPAEEIPSVSTLGRSYSHPSWSSTATDSLRTTITNEARMRPDIPQINYNSPSTYQSNAARNLLSSLSVGSEPLSTLGAYRPSTSSFLDYPKATSGAVATTTSSGNSTSSSIYQYRPSTEISSLLEKGFSSGTRPSSFLDDRTRTDRVTGISTERTVSSSSFLLSASKAAPDNLSTLGSTGSSYPKIFTKTASHDPRLNPALTTPEPAAPITPKRKLSINEYRQRKMQSSSSAPSTPAPASSSSEVATSSGSSSSTMTGSTDNNAISSSLGSNDVSSSISKELSLELEMELNESSEVDTSLVATTVVESKAAEGSSCSATNISAEPSYSEQTV